MEKRNLALIIYMISEMEERRTQPCIEHQMTILPTTPVMPVALQRNTFAAQGSVRRANASIRPPCPRALLQSRRRGLQLRPDTLVRVRLRVRHRK